MMLAVVSCEKVVCPPDPPIIDPVIPTMPVRIQALAHTLWTGSEAVAISLNNGTVVQSDSMSVFTETSSAYFYAHIDTIGATAPYRFDLFCPGDAVSGNSASGSFDIVVPSVQNAGKTGFDVSSDILYASAEIEEDKIPSTLSVKFEPILAYGTIEVNGLDADETVKSVSVSAKDAMLAGKVRFNAKTGSFETVQGSHSIEIKTEGSAKLAFACLPCENSGDITINVVTSKTSISKNISSKPFASGETSEISVKLKTTVDPDAMIFKRALTLAPGDIVTFVSNNGNQWYACGVPNSDNSLMAIDITAPDDGILGIKPNDNLDTFVVGGGEAGNDWTFTSQKMNAKIAWAQNVYKVDYSGTAAAEHMLTLGDVYEMRYRVQYTSSPGRMIQFSASTNQMNEGQPCFVYGAGAQADVFIYRKADTVDPVVELYGKATDVSVSGAKVSAAYQFDTPSKVGFEYTTDGNSWTSVESTATEKNGIGVFQETLSGIAPGATCTYKAFIYVNGKKYESGTSSFTTKANDYVTYAWVQPNVNDVWPESHVESEVGNKPTSWTIDITYPSGAPASLSNSLYEGRGFQIGTKSNPADRIVFTNTALKDVVIRSISFVGCVGADCTDPSISISVGGVAQKLNGSSTAGAVALGVGAATEYVCKPDQAGEIVITMSRSGTGRAMYFKSLTVETD